MILISNTVISNILRCDITDHYPTILTISNINNNENTTRNKFIVNKIDINHLNLLIRTENWYTCLNHDNVYDMIEVFNLKIRVYKLFNYLI